MPAAKCFPLNGQHPLLIENHVGIDTDCLQKFALRLVAARSQSSTRRHLHCSREFGPDGGEWIARQSPVPVRYRQSRAREIDPAGKMLEKYFPARLPGSLGRGPALAKLTDVHLTLGCNAGQLPPPCL